MSENRSVTTCVSFCETADPQAGIQNLIAVLERTCWEAGFPGCERVYAGSYFCENYFCGLTDGFHESMREICARHDMGATLVVPIVGQAHLARAERRVADVLARFGDLYDEIVVNDVAAFMWLSGLTDKRLGFGRLFSKGLRDARYPELFNAPNRPELSPEAQACLRMRPDARPLVEVDPASAVVDVSGLAGAEVAVHLPFCYATTGRNCSAASIGQPDSEKFRLGRSCNLECLRVVQGSRIEGGVRYVKHGRTYYYENPSCRIAGADSWRIIYAASDETMS